MKRLVLYVHGKGGSAAEARLYRPLFPLCDVVGLEYRGDTPWEAGEEIARAVDDAVEKYDDIVLIANSIGAYFSMCAGVEERISKAYFISPIVDMERLILDMMRRADVSEEELAEKRRIPTPFGETLSWEYLRYVREHPIRWRVATAILYGSLDDLTSYAAITAFADKHGASLTVAEGAEHWFHTEEQLALLREWITRENR